MLDFEVNMRTPSVPAIRPQKHLEMSAYFLYIAALHKEQLITIGAAELFPNGTDARTESVQPRLRLEQWTNTERDLLDLFPEQIPLGQQCQFRSSKRFIRIPYRLRILQLIPFPPFLVHKVLVISAQVHHKDNAIDPLRALAPIRCVHSGRFP